VNSNDGQEFLAKELQLLKQNMKVTYVFQSKKESSLELQH
jgi:hypothetical protein